MESENMERAFSPLQPVSARCGTSETPKTLYALRRVMLGIIDKGADRVRDHITCRVGPKECLGTALVARLSDVNRLTALAQTDNQHVERALVERVADVRGLLGRNITQTRQILRKLLKDEIVDGKRVPGRIRCRPFDDARGPATRFRLRAPMRG